MEWLHVPRSHVLMYKYKPREASSTSTIHVHHQPRLSRSNPEPPEPPRRNTKIISHFPIRTVLPILSTIPYPCPAISIHLPYPSNIPPSLPRHTSPPCSVVSPSSGQDLKSSYPLLARQEKRTQNKKQALSDPSLPLLLPRA